MAWKIGSHLMTWHRAIVAAAVLSTSALACEVILGIKSDDFRVADAATIPDPCVHALPPPAPDASDVGPALPPLVFAFERSHIGGRNDAGLTSGFDLDGVCTCSAGPGSAHDGGPSCSPRAPDASSCDGEGGVDNTASIVIPPAFAAQYDAVFTDDSNCGRQTVLVQLTEYNGRADDPQVVVALATSYGIFDPHDGGDDLVYAAGCGNYPAVDGGGYPAKHDGTDVWSVEAASVAQGILRERFQGYVTNGTLVVKLDVEGDIGGWSLVVGGRVVPLRTAILTAKLNRQPNGSFRLDEGVVTGRVAVDDVLAGIGSLRVTGEDYICNHPEIYEPLKKLACASSDLAKLPSRDFSGASCDAVSLVLEFTAEPAVIGHAEPPQGVPKTGCGRGWVDTCPAAP